MIHSVQLKEVRWLLYLGFVAFGALHGSVSAQRTDENAVASAEDAFGTTVGHESIGIYSDSSVRGFSPAAAGNFRIEGIYCDTPYSLVSHILEDETIRVGPAAQGYSFPAPTGIVDLSLRQSGDTKAFSTLAYVSSFGTRGFEMDAQVPLRPDRWSAAVGGSVYEDRFANGGQQKEGSFGIVPRWRLGSNGEITCFCSLHRIWGQTYQAIYIPTGDFLPAHITRGVYPGPDWDKSDQTTASCGVLGHLFVGDWTLRSGLFYSYADSGVMFPNIVTVFPDNTTDRSVYAQPASSSFSWSGEARASRELDEGSCKHLFLISVRARKVKTTYGDSVSHDFGIAGLNAVITPDRPEFSFGPFTQDEIEQITGGLSYGLNWLQVCEATFGLQHTDYCKNVLAPGTTGERRYNRVWMPSVSVAKSVTKRVSLYCSYVHGVEDSGTAPGFSSNAGQVLPASRTHQWDAGIKWSINDSSTLIAGFFDVRKPYLSVDGANYYGQIGTEIHRGLELSLTTTPFKELKVVVGGNIGDPRVEASPNLASPIGKRPVGQPSTTLQLNIGYTLPFAKAVSLDASVNRQSSQAGTDNNVIIIPGFTSFGLGLRYQVKIGGKQWEVRVSGDNLNNVYRLSPLSSGVYVYNNQRNGRIYLTTDF